MFKNIKKTSALFAVIILLAVNIFPVSGQSSSIDLFAVSDMANIFEDGYNCPQHRSAIDVFGIKNEYITAQCVIKANDNLNNITVSVGQLKIDNSTGSLPSDAVEWNFVGSIPLEKNNPARGQDNVIRSAPARFPDYLAEDKEISLKKGEYRAVWLTIKVPKYAKEGKYSGSVTVTTSKGSASLPLYLTIYPLTLPDKRHLAVTMWYGAGRFKKFHNVEEPYSDRYYKMLKIYADNMAEHRQNAFRVPFREVIIKQDRNGKIYLDYSRFDKWAQIFWDTGKMDLLETGFLATFGKERWQSTKIYLQDFRVLNEATGEYITIPGKECIPKFLPLFVDHLKEKGWLEKTVFHVQDEPSVHNIRSWREVSEFIHKIAPSLRRMDAVETSHFFDDLEIWVPKLNYFNTLNDTYREAQIKGYEVWFYTVGIYQGGVVPNRIVDAPLIESRIMHWINTRYGLTGYLHWGLHSWTDDPYNDPGMHQGDGWQVYPSKDGNGLVNSIRWEQMRNGIQDYEYFWLLEDKIKSYLSRLEKHSDMFKASQRGVEISGQVIKTVGDFSTNPKVLYKAKKQVIDEILALDTKPLLIVQTNPPEFTEVIREGKVDVMGMTGPGTKITVNGRELPVTPDGLFMELFVVDSETSEITVTAESSRGKKTVVRKFDIVK